MDDLNAMLSQVLSDPQAMQQIQEVAASLGLGGDGGNTAPDPPPQNASPALDMNALSTLLQGLGGTPSAPDPPAQNTSPGLDMNALSTLLQGLGGTPSAPDPPPQNTSPGLDMNALSTLLQGLSGTPSAPDPPQTAQTPDLTSLTSLLQNAMGGNPSTPAPVQSGGGLDLSSLTNILSGITGNQQNTNQGTDLSALTSLLSAGQPAPPAGQGGGLPFDMNTLLKVQKAMSSIGSNQGNIQLLLALKPRLKEKRAKKIDDAIRVMQLIQFLPLIKDSGLFGDSSSGIGSIVDGLGNNINQMLGGILGGMGGKS